MKWIMDKAEIIIKKTAVSIFAVISIILMIMTYGSEKIFYSMSLFLGLREDIYIVYGSTYTSQEVPNSIACFGYIFIIGLVIYTCSKYTKVREQ